LAKPRRKKPKKSSAPASSSTESFAESIREWIKSLGIAVILYLFIRTFILQTFVITSGSMMNTLLVGDLVVANRLAIGTRIPLTNIRIPGYSHPRRGDVMVFDPHHDDTLTLVKRVGGMPGDTLQMLDGVLSVNGVALLEPYVRSGSGPDMESPEFAWQREFLTPEVDQGTYTPTLHNWGPIVIPTNHFFMIGDNRDASYDSRYWGPLEGWRFLARISFTYFSYDSESMRPFPALRDARWGRIGPFKHGSAP